MNLNTNAYQNPTNQTPYTLLTRLTGQGLKISVYNKKNQSILQGTLPTLSTQQTLAQYFETLDQLSHYIKQKNNIYVNFQQRYLSIITRMTTKKLKQIQIGKIYLKQADILNGGKYKINQIIKNCQNTSAVFNAKSVIRDLAMIVNQILTKNQKYQENRQNITSNQHIKRPQLTNSLRVMRQNIEKQQQQMKSKIDEIIESRDGQDQYSCRLEDQGLSLKCFQYQNRYQQLQKPQPRQQFVLKIIGSFKNNSDHFNLGTNQNISNLLNNPAYNFNNKVNFNPQKFKNVQIKHIPPPKLNPKNSKQWIDPQCVHYKNLQLSNNSISALEYSYIFSKKKPKSPIHKSYVFSVKIDKMNQWMYLGIIDNNYKNKQDLSGAENRILYSNNGDLRYGKEIRKRQGKQFKQGQEIFVSYDLNLGKIQWRVASEIIYALYSEKLRDEKIEWVPFINVQSEDVVRIHQ